MRITAVDQNGHAFQDDLGEGDIWNFPAASPIRFKDSRDSTVTARSSCSSSTMQLQ
jgi:hypothetical protein